MITHKKNKGTLSQCTICNDGAIIKSTVWSIHWQRKHCNIKEANIQYITIDKLNEKIRDDKLERDSTEVQEKGTQNEPKEAHLCSQKKAMTDATSIKINLDEISQGPSSQLPELIQKLIDSNE